MSIAPHLPMHTTVQRDEMFELIENVVNHNDALAMKFLRGRLIAASRKRRIPFDIAEEAFQETMLSLAKNSSNFLDADSPNSYIYTVYFRFISHIIQKNRTPESTWSIGDAQGLQDYRTVDPSIAAIRTENRARFNKMIPANEVHAQILQMRILEGASHAEIASAIGKDEKYVRGMYSKLSRRVLKELGIIDDE